MKLTTIATITTMALSFSIASGASSQQTDTTDTTFSDLICPAIAEYAYSAMSARQRGVSLQQLLDLIDTRNSDFKHTLRNIVLGAFDRPRMSVERNQERLSVDYRNEWHLLCIRSLE